ncbi:hypothetical protein AB6D76_10995 [Vibrio splendidus]
MSKLITSSFISNVKKSAKQLKKELGISHSEALEVTSKKAGFASYYALQNSHANQSKLSVSPKKFARQFLISFIESDAGIAGIEHSRSTIERHHPNQDLKPIVLSTLLDVFDFGLNHDDININAKWSILKWALDTERMKEIGQQALEDDKEGFQIKGALLIALGHFYRSTGYCLSDHRLIHANFETYVSDWVRSVSVYNTTATTALSRAFPKNKTSGISPGSSVWSHLA